MKTRLFVNKHCRCHVNQFVCKQTFVILTIVFKIVLFFLKLVHGWWIR